MLVTCFGYLGYKNARFGKIEAHEAVTAYGRDKLLTAKEIFEAAGFTVLHGLTDCLWVQKPGILGRTCCPPRRSWAGQIVCREHGFRVTGVKLALEGVYRWIFFMASKQDPKRPVATRYFGVFADGSLKVRGLMCRRRDTPPFVRRAQEAMLAKWPRPLRPGNWRPCGLSWRRWPKASGSASGREALIPRTWSLPGCCPTGGGL